MTFCVLVRSAILNTHTHLLLQRDRDLGDARREVLRRPVLQQRVLCKGGEQFFDDQ